MKFKYDIDYVATITKIEKEDIDKLLAYFAALPLMAKLEVFYISKLVEEEDEFAFLQHHFQREKIAEYEFALFILGVDRLFQLENRDVENMNLSDYKLKQIALFKSLRDSFKNK